MNLTLVIAALLLLTGCSTPAVVNRSEVESDLPAREVLALESLPGGQLNWAGRIIEIHTLDEETLIEVLGYPTHQSGRPDTDARSTGRFLISTDEVLDPLVYKPGELVSTVGRLIRVQQWNLGSVASRFPVIQGDQLVVVGELKETFTPYFSIGFGFGF